MRARTTDSVAALRHTHAMTEATFFWHDYETTGIDPRRDRIAQFAGIRTTLTLEQVGEPVNLLCQPAPDVLNHPTATLITGITPQQMQREGIAEPEFAAQVQLHMGEANTCSTGYNTIRFDDVFTRNLLYRNFYDPYEREWRNGCSRWDLIDVVRMCHALRPEGIEWPLREDGAPSFRLEDLSAANGLSHEQAHDALSDVHATIALARLVRSRQPRLFDHLFALRKKQAVWRWVDIDGMTPLLHVSSRYLASRGCLAAIAPLARHPQRRDSFIAYDLDVDPAPLLELEADDIADRVFTPRADLPEGIERIPLKLVHANQSPALAPLGVLAGVDHGRIGLDMERAERHRRVLLDQDAVRSKVQQVFASNREVEDMPDAELALYNGFLPDSDRPLLEQVRRSAPDALRPLMQRFSDPRYGTLLFRYRARHYPQTLDNEEQRLWEDFRHRRLTTATDLTPLPLDEYMQLITEMRGSTGTGAQPLLDALEAWAIETTQS